MDVDQTEKHGSRRDEQCLYCCIKHLVFEQLDVGQVEASNQNGHLAEDECKNSGECSQ